MTYCTNCGSELPGDLDIAPDPVAEAAHADVEVARIQADRDIKLARIQARMATEDLEVEVAADEATIAVLENEVLAPAGDAPEQDPGTPVTIVEAPAQVPEQPEEEAAAPPQGEHHEPASEPAGKSSGSGYGSSAWFGSR
jgi:hypothetical protein